MDIKNRRKKLNFSVNRKMQIRFFIKILGIALIGVVIMAVVFYFYSDREINSSYRQFHIHANNFLEMLFPAVVLSILLAVVAAVAITLFIPVKIAGPLYRIERDIKERVGSGDLTLRVKLRKGDEFGDLAETINGTIDTLKQKLKMVVEPLEEIETSLNSGGENKEKEVRALVIRIKEALKEFKLD